jgi:hypothetical protein
MNSVFPVRRKNGAASQCKVFIMCWHIEGADSDYMVEDKTSQQRPKKQETETASGDAGRIFGQDRIMVIAAAAVLVIAVIAVLIYASSVGSPVRSQTNSSIGTNIGSNTSQALPGTYSQAGTGIGGGTGQSYMSQIQMQEVIGPGGVYNASGNTNSALLGNYISSTNTTGFFYGNVTAVWIATDYINSSAAYSNLSAQPSNATRQQTVSGILDVAYQSPKPLYLYTVLIRNETSYASANAMMVRNATLGGMTYTELRLPGASETTSLIGYKNNEVSTVLVVGKAVNATALASTVAGDMP